MCFLMFLWLYLRLSRISSVKSSKNFTIHHIQRVTNFKHKKVEFVEAVFFSFAFFISFTPARKLAFSLKKELRLK